MIPKLIHLCWLSGDPYPKKIQYCIDTWKKCLPDYEVMLWDTNRFDVNSLPWTKQAFEAKKYAYVADYIRMYAVYNYGGIYLDSDVEVLKSFDELLHLPYFVCTEAIPTSVEVAAFGAEKGTPWVKDAMEYYVGRNFIKEDGDKDMTVMPVVMGRLLREKYQWTPIDSLSDFDPDPAKFCILPLDWFGAHPADEQGTRYYITENTHSIHHYANSWNDQYMGGKLHEWFFKLFGINWRFLDRSFKLYGTQKKK